MDDMLKYFKEDLTRYWCDQGYEWLCWNWEMLIESGLLVWGVPAIWLLLKSIWKGGYWLVNFLYERKWSKDLHPYFSFQDVRKHTRHYVQSKGQNIAPVFKKKLERILMLRSFKRSSSHFSSKLHLKEARTIKGII